MKNILLGVMITLVVMLLFHGIVQAQTGQVIFLGATPGTTLAANCPATPATSSACNVGDGFWIWQPDTKVWFKPEPPATAVAGVTSVNGKTGAVVLSATTTVQ